MPRRARIRPDEPGHEKLLDAARELFGEQGYDATSIAEIGVRAGIAKSVLYHHFGSKAALYQAVIEADGRALVGAVAAAVPPPGRAGARLGPGVDAYLQFLSGHPTTWRLLLRDPPRDRGLRRAHEAVARDVGTALRGLLAHPGKAKAKPQLVDLVALAIRVYAAWWYDHRDVSREHVVAAISDVAAAGARRVGR